MHTHRHLERGSVHRHLAHRRSGAGLGPQHQPVSAAGQRLAVGGGYGRRRLIVAASPAGGQQHAGGRPAAGCVGGSTLARVHTSVSSQLSIALARHPQGMKRGRKWPPLPLAGEGWGGGVCARWPYQRRAYPHPSPLPGVEGAKSSASSGMWWPVSSQLSHNVAKNDPLSGPRRYGGPCGVSPGRWLRAATPAGRPPCHG